MAVRVDLGSAQACSCLALVGLNISAAGTVRVTASNASPTAVELYDSTPLTGCDPDFRLYIRPFTSVTARWWQAIVSDPSLSFIEAGRLVLGELWTPKIGHQFGLPDGIRRSSNNSVSTGGQSWTDILHDKRTMSPIFPAIEQADKLARLADIRRFGARGKDILFVPNTGSDNLSRDSLWGELESDVVFVRNRFNINQMSMALAERL